MSRSFRSGLLVNYELGDGSKIPPSPKYRPPPSLSRQFSQGEDNTAHSPLQYDPETGDWSSKRIGPPPKIKARATEDASPALSNISEGGCLEEALLPGSPRSPRDEPSSPTLAERAEEEKIAGYRRFRLYLGFLLLDHRNHTVRKLLCFVVGFGLVFAVPVADYIWVSPTDQAKELPFRSLVLVLEASIALVSFLFVVDTTAKHGLRGVLLLNLLKQEDPAVQKAYRESLQSCAALLLKLLLPAFAFHLGQRLLWWYSVPLKPFPVDIRHSHVPEILFFILSAYSWVFRTMTFLFVCVLFSSICNLQWLKMRHYSHVLEMTVDPSWCFHEYTRLCHGLVVISHRFRAFLALSGLLTLLGMLASMYLVVGKRKGELTFLNSADLIVCNWVYINGAWLCLQAASKIAHFHRRIVKLAATMHAEISCDYSFSPPASSRPSSPPKRFEGQGVVGGVDMALAADPEVGDVGKEESKLEIGQEGTVLQAWINRVDAFQQRAALVGFLSQSTAGISVYGFVLDRFFVHTSFGALCTTTWFILGRSLGA